MSIDRNNLQPRYIKRPGASFCARILFIFFLKVANLFKPAVKHLRFVNGKQDLEVHFRSDGLEESYTFAEFEQSEYFHTLGTTEIQKLYQIKRQYDLLHPKYRLVKSEKIRGVFLVQATGLEKSLEMFFTEIIKDKDIISNLCTEDLKALAGAVEQSMKKTSVTNLQIIK